MELERLLGYVAAHRDGRKIFNPSNMLLDILTDASYLSLPKAGSVGGSFHHLTRVKDPDFVNVPISVHSAGISSVCSSVQEAEYAGTFALTKLSKSCDMRLHWLQDRVAQRQFIVRHIPGAINVADFYIKPMPVHRHKFLEPFIASDIGGSKFSLRLDRKLTKSK